MIDAKDIVASSQFAPLEPSWSGIRDENQLHGLLVLGSLFNECLYVHDTQLADNPHLLNAYRSRNEKHFNLYNLTRSLIETRVIRVAIRDETYIAKTDDHIYCDSLNDVYNSWLTQDIEKAWVIPPHEEKRIKLINNIDDILNEVDPIRYPYIDIKKEFMKRARTAVEKASIPEFTYQFQNLKPKIRSKYLKIIQRNWFSHSDIYDLLTRSGISLYNPFVQAHGLFDESSYAHWHNSRLLGCDSTLWKAEEMVLGNRNNIQKTIKFNENRINVNEILGRVPSPVNL